MGIRQRTRNKMERGLCISLLLRARRMPGRAARLQPFTQSKLLTRHFLSQHARVLAHVRTWQSAVKTGSEFCRRFLALFRYPPACASRLPTRGKPFCNWVWLLNRRVISAPRVFDLGDWKVGQAVCLSPGESGGGTLDTGDCEPSGGKIRREWKYGWALVLS